MPKNPVFLSSKTVCVPYAVSPQRSFSFIKECGFDGVEIFLNTRMIKTHIPAIKIASKLGLGVTFQRWHHTPRNNFLTALKILPPRSTTPRALILGDKGDRRKFSWPITILSAYWDERMDFPFTLIEPDPEVSRSDPVIYLKTLQQMIKSSRAKISFDPLRWLQYECGPRMPISTVDMLGVVLPAFVKFATQIEQIRMHDFCPPQQVGGRIIQERGLFPGEGIFPIKRFFEEISELGWRGKIVWDINPRRIIFTPWNVKQRLRQLPAQVHSAGL